jgi:hypothetical protein
VYEWRPAETFPKHLPHETDRRGSSRSKVVAELSRRGFIATTFTGNVPSYDIVAVDEQGGRALGQVKAIEGRTLQLDLRKFARIEINGQQQMLHGQLDELPRSHLRDR